MATSTAASIVWEWMSDALLWKPFNSALSNAIEAGFQAHQPSVDLCVASPSTSAPAPALAPSCSPGLASPAAAPALAPTHTIIFESQPPCQTTWGSRRSRPVRRNVDPQTRAVEWQWCEDVSQQWRSFDVSINSQIESAWAQCHSSSNAYLQASAPGGVSIRINHRKYTIEFEADGVQKNMFSQFSRKVRRRLVSAAAMVGPAASASAPYASLSQQVVSVPPPSIAAGTVSLAYSANDLQPHVENSDDDCPICVMSLRERNSVMLVRCRHVFCKDCIMRWFETRPTCPVCTMAYGVITGNQPNGTMSVRIIPAGSPEFGSGLEGFPDVDVIQIHYNFPCGIQGPEHPSPGRRYTGTRRTAYLPSTKEGEDVLSLLKTAWDRRLLFSVGTSITTGRRDVVTWAGVHHKTNAWGGPQNFGYPDATYFARVKAELAERGVR